MGRGRNDVPDGVRMEFYDEQDARSREDAPRILTDAWLLVSIYPVSVSTDMAVLNSLERGEHGVMMPHFSNSNYCVQDLIVKLPAPPCLSKLRRGMPLHSNLELPY